MKKRLIKLHLFFTSQLGIDIRRFLRSIRGIPDYLKDWWHFSKNYHGSILFNPCLNDRYEEGGITKSEYFWQDLLVARKIFEAIPYKHVDVGSRVDGFVAHVASFREIEVLDVRPITSSIPGVVFHRLDLMQPLPIKMLAGYCDSLSCLHTIEHFGLGRYGDPIDPFGYEKGMSNLAALLKVGGILYLSCPLGKERVEFNAHRVFDPRTLINLAVKNNMLIKFLTVISASGEIREIDSSIPESLQILADNAYTLGIFIFIKTN